MNYLTMGRTLEGVADELCALLVKRRFHYYDFVNLVSDTVQSFDKEFEINVTPMAIDTCSLALLSEVAKPNDMDLQDLIQWLPYTASR